MTSTAQSYVVSDSGAMFSLGSRYHVTSSGVQEFKRASCNLGVAASSESGLVCRHVDDLDFDHGMQIGCGSSGKVFDVLHVPSGVRVCVKQMLIDDARHRDEIKRELDSLHKAPSRFIVDFYGAFFHHDLGVILLVLELMDGSLQDVLRMRPQLPEFVAKAFAFQLVHGLQVLHGERQLIHRDIKPGNILFHRSGSVKITDFGVSRGQLSQDQNSVHTFVGSVLYMSPERLEGKAYGFEADVWSLGVLLCEAVTGVHPFQTDASPGAPPPTFWSLLQCVAGTAGANPLDSAVSRMEACGRPCPMPSADMLSFVGQCLALDRPARPTATQLLNHPWLLSMTLEESVNMVSSVANDAAAQLHHSRQGGGLPVSLAAGSGATAGSGSSAASADARQRSDALLNDLMASVTRR